MKRLRTMFMVVACIVLLLICIRQWRMLQDLDTKLPIFTHVEQIIIVYPAALAPDDTPYIPAQWHVEIIVPSARVDAFIDMLDATPLPVQASTVFPLPWTLCCDQFTPTAYQETYRDGVIPPLSHFVLPAGVESPTGFIHPGLPTDSSKHPPVATPENGTWILLVSGIVILFIVIHYLQWRR